MDQVTEQEPKRGWLRYLKWFFLIASLFCLLFVAKHWSSIKKLFRKPALSNVMIEMADGVALATDVYLPRKDAKLTTVLLRTPYGKRVQPSKLFVFDYDVAFVVQDTRGRGKSKGAFYPFRHEREDGLQTLAWIKKQQWSNGRVIGLGLSYPAVASWAIIDELDATIGVGGCRDCYDLLYPGGLFSLQTSLRWTFVMAGSKKKILSASGADEVYAKLPLNEVDNTHHQNIDYWDDWLAHEERDDYWLKMANNRPLKGPLLSIAGWYDIFLYSQLKDFERLVSTSPASKMVIGPWAHGPFGAKIDIGKNNNVIWAFEKMKPFLKSQIERYKKDSSARYTLFIIHRNQWNECENWPPEKTEMTNFYLGEKGTLSREKEKSGKTLSYVYEPQNPMPSYGGTSLGNKVGPAWQKKNENRKDCLLFQTEILPKPLTLLGPLSAKICVKSSAPKTNFILLLQDVYPDGKILNIQEGGCPVHFKDNNEEAQVDVNIWATGYELRKGHRLRLVVTSSWFPRFNRSSNTKVNQAEATKLVKAEQILVCGGARASFLRLPIFKD